MIDASIPLQGQAPNLAQIFHQGRQMQMRETQMQRQAELEEMQLLAKLDADQRERMKAGIEDLSAAVQWADTPEKWAQVQQHYGQFDPQLAQVPFQNREMALVKLGKMGDYLKATQPKDKTSGIAQELLDAGYQPGTPEFETAMRGVINNKYASEYVDENGNTRRRSALSLGGAPMPSAPVTKTIGGKTYYQQNGKWYEGDAGSNASGGFPAR